MSIKDFNGTNIVNGLDMGNFYPGEYLNVKIFIDTAYQWGPGWYGNIDQKTLFDNETRSLLKKVGFKIEEPTVCGASPNLKSGNKKTNLYLHPLKFSGFATQKEIDTIVETLKTFKSVKEVVDVVTTPSYDINKTQHARILSMNIKLIEDFIREKAKKMRANDIPAEFAKTYAIMTTGKSCVFGSDIFEWKYVETIVDIMIAKGELDTPNEWY